MGLSPHEYRDLLSTALSHAVDSDTIEPDVRTLFTPTTHRRALDPDATVVQGGRGVGKTVWFKALQDDALRRLAAEEYHLTRLNAIEPRAGYGTELVPGKYPSQRTLGHLVTRFQHTEDIWTAVVLHSFGYAETSRLADWSDRVQWVLDNPEPVERALAKADEEAGARGFTVLFLFDALDRLHSRRDIADRLVGGILKVALDLRTRTRNLRAKVFIRHDMFDSVKLNFPDASKLTANAADLTWSPTSLYGLLFHQLGNSGTPLSEMFIESTRSTGQWNRNPLRNTPARSLIADHEEQRKLFADIAGPYMGKDHRKGITYTWLPNHLTDGLGQVSPRSFLSALTTATEVTREKYHAHTTALHWDGIRQGVQTASGIRVTEIREDIPWVSTAIEPLAGLQVPIEQAEVIQRWTERDLRDELDRLSESTAQNDAEKMAAPTGPLTTDYSALIGELIELGVMSRRANGKLDLPDVYRIAFDLGRKGGVPRIRP